MTACFVFLNTYLNFKLKTCCIDEFRTLIASHSLRFFVFFSNPSPTCILILSHKQISYITRIQLSVLMGWDELNIASGLREFNTGVLSEDLCCCCCIVSLLVTALFVYSGPAAGVVSLHPPHRFVLTLIPHWANFTKHVYLIPGCFLSACVAVRGLASHVYLMCFKTQNHA